MRIIIETEIILNFFFFFIFNEFVLISWYTFDNISDWFNRLMSKIVR